MARVFGFDESAAQMDVYVAKSDKAMQAVKEVAEEMQQEAQSIFSSRKKTGQGIAGIVIKEEKSKVTVGWSERPGLHGYFHELGFHAVDNRRKKQRIPRTNRSRKRIYKNVKATYVPPFPHMRPAFDKHEKDLEIKVRNAIT